MQAFKALKIELSRLEARYVVISTNLELKRNGEPYSNPANVADTGIAVYFQLNGRSYAMPCDRWQSIADNLWAVAKHIEAMRGQMRWGVANVEQAFAGFKALAADVESVHCWNVLGVSRAGATVAAVNDAYRTLAKVYHPDMANGSTDEMARLNAARDQALAQLAG